MSEVIGRKTEHVHRYRSRIGQRAEFALLILVFDYPIDTFDRGTLNHRGEVVIGIHFTNRTRDSTVIRQRLLYLVSDHTVVVGLACHRAQIVANGLVSLPTIEVIGIDHREGTVDNVGSHHHRMVGSPGFYTISRNGKAFRKFVQLLEYKIYLNLATKTFGSKNFTKFLFKKVTDNKYDLAESGTNSIVDRIVDNSLAAGADTVHLFE